MRIAFVTMMVFTLIPPLVAESDDAYESAYSKCFAALGTDCTDCFCVRETCSYRACIAANRETLVSRDPAKYIPVQALASQCESQLDSMVECHLAFLSPARPPVKHDNQTHIQETKVFVHPTFGEARLDWCSGDPVRTCGAGVASTYCRSLGYDNALEYSGPDIEPRITRQIGSNTVCEASYCSGFDFIKCIKHRQP